MYRSSVFALLLGAASRSWAALPIPNITPFLVDGALDSCSPSSTAYNSGGSISVNGFNIQVPENLIAQFPVTWVPFRQMCEEAAVLGFEVSVAGNMINGQAIAAQINVGSPFFLEGSQGYIEEVNVEQAYLKIRGGPIVKINDPNAVFTKGLVQRPLFQVDDENPSVTAFSGFPMCIPRNSTDPLCPSSNRPAGQTNFQAPDSLAMAPFQSGDFIEYSGLKVGGGEILAWAITAINVQITTRASSTVPNYIRMEDALIGVFDNAANVEVADIRFIGYLSSCAGATVTVFALDVDPCTGVETEREIGTAVPKNGDQRCKWEFRVDTVNQNTYTREYMIRANSPVVETKSGIKGSQYVQPVTEWIQSEVDVPGTEPPPLRFQNIRGLVQGDFLDGKQYGPLSPFPGSAPPAPSKTCSPDDIPTETPTASPTSPPTSTPEVIVPVASAAPIALAQRVGASVVLSGANTAQNIPAANLVYSWTKVSPASSSISIQSAASPTATFTAPPVTADTNITFTLTLSLKSNSTIKSSANVTVLVSRTALDVVTLDTYTWESRQSGTISVTCRSNVVNGDNKRMTLVLNGNGAITGGTRITMPAGSGPGKWVYSARSTARPTNVQCVSDLGGKSAVVTATTSRRRRGLLGVESAVSRAEFV